MSEKVYNTNAIMALIAFGAVVVGGIAIMTMLNYDGLDCSPVAIERRTQDIIAYKDCLALENCTTTPDDVRRYNNSQARFDACVSMASKDE